MENDLDIKLYNELIRLNNIYYSFIKDYYNINDEELEKTINNISEISHELNEYYNLIDYTNEIDTTNANKLINKFPMLELIYKYPMSTKKLELIKRSSN